MSARTVRVLSTPAVATGFGLAAVPAEPLTRASDPAETLAGLLRRPDLGVLLVEEAVYDALPPELRRRLERSSAPVVVPFPSPGWTASRRAEDQVVELLRRAIGYRVRLR